MLLRPLSRWRDDLPPAAATTTAASVEEPADWRLFDHTLVATLGWLLALLLVRLTQQ